MVVYNAKTQRGLLVFFFLIIATTISIKDFTNGLIYFKLGLIIFIIISCFINFKLKIDERNLVYQIFFLSLPIYKKEVNPNQLAMIKFKRVGWTAKGAMIHMKKGFNIPISHYSPDTILVDLTKFANVNNISISKTKDYTLLE